MVFKVVSTDKHCCKDCVQEGPHLLKLTLFNLFAYLQQDNEG